MSNSGKETSEQYERLRAWYLASLRSSAINDLLGVDNASMTPAALIHADSRLMQKLVGDDTARLEVADTAKTNQRDVSLVILSALVLLAAACALTFML